MHFHSPLILISHQLIHELGQEGKRKKQLETVFKFLNASLCFYFLSSHSAVLVLAWQTESAKQGNQLGNLQHSPLKEMGAFLGLQVGVGRGKVFTFPSQLPYCQILPGLPVLSLGLHQINPGFQVITLGHMSLQHYHSVIIYKLICVFLSLCLSPLLEYQNPENSCLSLFLLLTART